MSSKIGHVNLSDGTTILIRAIIADIVEGEMKPVGPDLQIGLQIISTVKAPEELRKKVQNKPLPPSDKSHLKNMEIWEIIKIIRKDDAVEECLYKASDGRTYKISVRIEVTIVARTLEYRDRGSNPIYHFRWFPCIKVSIAED